MKLAEKPLAIAVGIASLVAIVVLPVPFPGRYRLEVVNPATTVTIDTWTGKSWTKTASPDATPTPYAAPTHDPVAAESGRRRVRGSYVAQRAIDSMGADDDEFSELIESEEFGSLSKEKQDRFIELWDQVVTKNTTKYKAHHPDAKPDPDLLKKKAEMKAIILELQAKGY